MLLKNILKKIPHKEVIGSNLDCDIEFVSTDSRLLFENSLFVARKGARIDALEFIPKIKNKVNCFAVSLQDKERVNAVSKRLAGKVFMVVRDLDTTLKELSKIFHKGIEKLNIIGITGTNGKTTVGFLINKILNDCGRPSALLGTVSYKWGKTSFGSLLTTPDNFMLKSILSQVIKENISNVVLEVSSHGLAQGRIDGLSLNRAIFTNLSQDHLDFHKNFENYFKAKLRIFDYLTRGGMALINIDDKYGYSAYRRLKADKLSFGIKQQASYKARAYRFQKNRLEFLINLRGRDYIVRAHLLGIFNIYNILAALSCCDSLRLDLNRVIESIFQFKRPPGRLQPVKDGIFIDYAHTPLALKEAISALRVANFKKIIVVFGCGGDRDRLKRPKMGRVVSLYADYAIITSDNPRSERPSKICKDIERGFLGKNYEITVDRKKAIAKAIKLKKGESTAILIAGKGHENYQIFRDRTIKFSDRRVVRDLINGS